MTDAIPSSERVAWFCRDGNLSLPGQSNASWSEAQLHQCEMQKTAYRVTFSANKILRTLK
jgi:hypothetical protein